MSSAKDQKELNQKEQALTAAISQIEKQFGKGSIMKLGDDSAKVRVEAISTGSLELDIALGIGGIPRGRVTEIYGPESSGKTTLTLHAVAEAQKAGGIAAFVDAEHALDPSYAAKPMISLFHSRTPERRPLKLPRALSVPVLLILLLSIRSRRWSPVRKLKGIWAIHTWGSRRG